MGQLEDFRASLKRKDSAVSSEGEIPVKSIAKAKQEKMKRRTLGVSGELHLELKALSVWRIKSHPKGSSVSEGCPIGSGMPTGTLRRGMGIPDQVGDDGRSGDATSLPALTSFQGIPPLSSALSPSHCFHIPAFS